MRTRTSGFTKPTITCYTDYYGAYGTCADPTKLQYKSTSSQNYVPEEESVVMHDLVTPQWHRKRNAGEIVNNPYDRTVVNTKRTPFSTWIEDRRIYNWQSCSGVNTAIVNTGGRWVGTKAPDGYLGSTFLTPPSLGRDTYRGLAITAARSKISEADVQMLVTIAEGKKTIQSLTAIFARLYRILKAMRKSQMWELRRELTAKQLSDRWMEGRYAIRPLVYDMVGIVKAITHDRNSKPIRQTFRGGASDSSTTNQSGVVTFGFLDYYEIRAYKESSLVISARAGVLTAVEEILEATIWGLNQPIQAVWELIPFSFVVDWFFNVGKTIASWSPTFGYKALASWCVVTETTVQSIIAQGGFRRSWTPVSGGKFTDEITASGGSIIKTTQTKMRIAEPSAPILPQFSLRLDAAKLLDLAIMSRRIFA